MSPDVSTAWGPPGSGVKDGNTELEACADKFGLGSHARELSAGVSHQNIYFSKIMRFQRGPSDNEMNCSSPGEK